jgi:outer membrane protein TolC
MRALSFHSLMCFLVLVCGLVRPAWAASLTLDECVAWALRESPERIAARLDTAIAAQGSAAVEGAYDLRWTTDARYQTSSLPSPQNPFADESDSVTVAAELGRTLASGTRLGVGVDASRTEYGEAGAVPFDTDPYTSIYYVSLRQPLLRDAWGGLVRAQRRAADRRQAAAEAAEEEARQSIAGVVHALYWEAYRARALYDVNARALGWSEQLLDVNRQRVADHLLDETDALAAEAALASRRVDLLALAAVRDQQRERLLEVIGWPLADWDATTLQFPTNALAAEVEAPEVPAWPVLLDEAEAARADFEVLARQREALEAEMAQARQGVRPDVSLMGRYGVGESGERYRDTWGVDGDQWMVGLQVDWPLERSAEKAALRQAELALEQHQVQVDALRRSVGRALRDAVRQVETAAQQVAAARQARDLHEAKWRAEQEKLAQGRSSTAQVIRYQEDLELAEAGVVSAWTAYQQAVSALALERGRLAPAEETP